MLKETKFLAMAPTKKEVLELRDKFAKALVEKGLQHEYAVQWRRKSPRTFVVELIYDPIDGDNKST